MSRNAKPADPLDVIAPARALVPAVQKVNEARVRKGFWPKVTRTAARLPFLRQLLQVYYCARDPDTPTAAKGVMLAALAYFVLPVDIIPDVLAGIGYTDDAAVLAAVISMLGAHIRPRHRDEAEAAIGRLRAEEISR